MSSLNTRLYDYTNTTYDYTIYFVQDITWVVVYKSSLDDNTGKTPYLDFIYNYCSSSPINEQPASIAHVVSEVRLHIDYLEKYN